MKKQITFIQILFLFICMYAQTSHASNTNPPHDSLTITTPNIFTPNGDGVNDTWSIIVHDFGIVLFDLQTTVYDRWGKEVFQTTNIHEVWSGHNLLGKPCDAGSYFYVVTYTNSSTENPEVLKGFITLVR